LLCLVDCLLNMKLIVLLPVAIAFDEPDALLQSRKLVGGEQDQHQHVYPQRPVCGDGVCDDSELSPKSLGNPKCMADCEEQIRGAVCSCAANADMCSEFCPALADADARCQTWYTMGVCGNIIPNNKTYSDICGLEHCKPVCGDNICEKDEEMQCPEDCRKEIMAGVCKCAVANQMCSEECPALSKLGDEDECQSYYAMGVCGGIIPDGKTYGEMCDGCKSKPCCKAQTAKCMSCSTGINLKEYCKRFPKTQGCCENFDISCNGRKVPKCLPTGRGKDRKFVFKCKRP